MTQLDLTVASKERGLKDSEGWVTSSSTNDETEDRPIMPFWREGL
jgi:hypothetical protein